MLPPASRALLFTSWPFAVGAEGISQAQFWPQHPLSGYGDGQVKGLISVDVSN